MEQTQEMKENTQANIDDTTINIDGVEHRYGDLSDKAKYVIHQVEEVRREAQEHQRKLERAEMTQRGYLSVLSALIQEDGENAETE